MGKAKDGSVRLKLYVIYKHLFLIVFFAITMRLLYIRLFIRSFIYSFIRLSRPNGKSIVVPPHNVLINTHMRDVVSVSYESYLPQELPVNPKIYRVRDDISWEDVVNSFHKDRKYRNGIFLFGLFSYIRLLLYIY
jgi:hypothetical protein